MCAYLKFENPACDVTAPWPSSLSLDGELEASVLSVPAPSREFKTKRHMPRVLYYENEKFKAKMKRI